MSSYSVSFHRRATLVIALTAQLLLTPAARADQAPATPALPVVSAQPVSARHGMVVTAQHLATQVGVDILRRGGNAVDAAVAVGYALAVVFPAAGNLGGGGFMTLQLADGRQAFLDFREKAPLAAQADMYLDTQGQVVPRLSTKGHLAVGVPGSVAGLEAARQQFGSLPRSVVLAPAIRLAEQGFVLQQGDVDLLQAAAPELQRDPDAAAVFVKSTGAWAVGDRLRQPALTQTLRRIAAQGVDGFYQGPVAQELVRANRQGGGILTAQDLADYRVRSLKPIECDYRGYHIVSAPPPSSGGVVICEMLQILQGYPLQALGFHSAQAAHDQIEAMRHAYVDRNSYLGDPDFVDNPVAHLLDPAYAAQIRAVIQPQHAGVSSELRAGVAPHEGSNTTHYSIADRFGNAVAVTTTLNDWFGASVMAGRTGVMLNDEMDDFTVKIGAPNLYGLVQGQANVIAPGKRPLSSMSPTIVTRAGKPVAVLGTAGGSRIITEVMLTLVNLIDYDMNVQQAVNAPRFHQQWLPDVTYAEEDAFTPAVRQQLQAWGHHLGPPHPTKHMAAIVIGGSRLSTTAQDGLRFHGANDPRRNTGLALGY